jgi:hypothetical protein
MLRARASMPDQPTQGNCMTSTRIPDFSRSKGTPGAQLERIEADLARIVGPHGAQALLARSRHLCGSQAHSRAQLLRTLMQLVRKLLGKPLAAWLLQSAAAASPAVPAAPRSR